MDDISPALEAAATYVQSLVRKADAHQGGAPLWHGWALRVAFLQGVNFGREQAKEEMKQEAGNG